MGINVVGPSDVNVQKGYKHKGLNAAQKNS